MELSGKNTVKNETGNICFSKHKVEFEAEITIYLNFCSLFVLFVAVSS